MIYQPYQPSSEDELSIAETMGFKLRTFPSSIEREREMYIYIYLYTYIHGTNTQRKQGIQPTMDHDDPQ